MTQSQNNAGRCVDGDAILNALPNPVLLIGPDGKIVDANMAAESFFGDFHANFCNGSR